MKIESIAIADLHEDPANPRRHPEKNLKGLKASLARFGQQKPIVVDANNVVRAGNGTLIAARSLGWATINCVRSDLAGTDATAYAIADNQIALTATWDDDALASTLRALQEEDFDLDAVGFSDAEVDAMFGDDEEEDHADAGEEILAEKWMIAVDCRDEAHQVELLERFKEEGIACRAIVS